MSCTQSPEPLSELRPHAPSPASFPMAEPSHCTPSRRPRSHQPPPASGLSSTLACPELPRQGWASPASSSPCSGAAQGPSLPHPHGQLQKSGRGRRQRRPGSPAHPSGSSLFRGGGSWVRGWRCSAHARCPGPLILPLQPQPSTALTAQSCPAARLPSSHWAPSVAPPSGMGKGPRHPTRLRLPGCRQAAVCWAGR